MPDYIVVLLVLAGVLVLLLGLFFTPPVQKWYQQELTDRKRKRAHAGKVQCEDPDCEDIAIMLTPNGYFCDWHWEPMTKRMVPGGGYVTWNHVLYHHIRRP